MDKDTLATLDHDRLRVERDAANRQRDAAIAYIATLKNTRSWRITKPLRAVLHWLRYRSLHTDAETLDFLHQDSVPLDAPSTSRRSSSPGDAPTENRFDILCFANIDWTARFQRPQQLMSQFARHGYRVFYIVPSRSAEPGHAYSSLEVAPGVFEIALHRDEFVDCYNHRLGEQNLQAYATAIEQLAKNLRIKTAVSVVHLAFWAPLATRLRREHGWKIQYDCMDDWVGFPGIGQVLLEEEETLVRDADLMTVTAALLHDKWAKASSN